MPKVHLGLQKLQALELVLHKMAFQLSDKVVALHLNNGTAKGYLCNQGGTASLSFKISLLHLKCG